MPARSGQAARTFAGTLAERAMEQPQLVAADIAALAATVAPWIRRTPTLSVPWLALPDSATTLYIKMELWQVTGSFKARAALANMLALSDAERARGVTAVSAGNHAIATAFAARELGIDAKLVMTASAPELRVARARAYGAEVELADDVHAAFERAAGLVEHEGRVMIHPFEGLRTATATAAVGMELLEDVGRFHATAFHATASGATALDAVIVPIGGGGLAAGVASAVKLAAADCAVYGVEPTGADTMTRSLAAGAPVSIARVETIADSLGAPMAMPISYALCRRSIDEIVHVDDASLVAAMRRIFDALGLVVEPACAAALAALHGPLAERLRGRRVGILFCGSNINLSHWQQLLER